MKKKLLLLMLLTFLISGCSVEYNITIKDKNVSIDSNLIEKDSSKWDDVVIDNSLNQEEDGNHSHDDILCANGQCTNEDDTTVYERITFEDLIDLKTNKAEEAFKIEGLNKVKTKDKLGLNYKVNYDWNETVSLSKIFGSSTCYDNFSVLRYKDEEENDERLLLSTSKENKCFDIYNNIDEVKINIKTNHKVISHNADIVDDHNYQWIINKDNYNNKSLQIILSEDTVIDYKLLIIIAIIVGTVVIAIVTTFLVIRDKNKKANAI